jgi:hypothetical protein
MSDDLIRGGWRIIAERELAMRLPPLAMDALRAEIDRVEAIPGQTAEGTVAWIMVVARERGYLT